MSAPGTARRPLRPRVGTTLALLLAGAFLAYLSGLPPLIVFPAILGPIAVAIVLRTDPSGRGRALAPVPAVVGLLVGALAAPLGALPDLAAGLGGLVLLAWLADDPARPVGGIVRAATTLLVPALAVGIAWSSALLLPSSSASFGVAAGLLVFALVALAYLVSRPELFDREEAATS
jgi:hypothetical protein